MDTRSFIPKPRSRLRLIRAEDRPALVRLAADFHNASVYRRHPLSLEKVDALIDVALTNPDYLTILLVDAADDYAHGYLVGICHEHYFSTVKTVSDLGFYVDKAYRNPHAVRAMVDALEQWAFNQKGAVDITLGISSGIADESVLRFYRKFGYARGIHGVVKERPLS